MKKRITALALAIFMVMGTVDVVAGTEKTVSVTPMNMTINGQEVTLLKFDGTPAEGFAYDGTAITRYAIKSAVEGRLGSAILDFRDTYVDASR